MPSQRKTASAKDTASPRKMVQGVTRTTRSIAKKSAASKENADLVKQIPELVAPSSATVSKPSTADINPIQKDAKITNAISQTDSDRTVVVAFEACKSCHRFAKKAREIYAELCELLPAASGVRLELSINGDDGNEMKVRRGSFEISVYEKMADGEAKRKEIWTGLKKGPPRINKYPETKNVLDDILSLYK